MAVGPEPVEGGAPLPEPGPPVESPEDAGLGEGEVYHLHLRVSRGEEEGGEAVAEDAWNFDASDDDEAIMVAAQVLADTFGAEGGMEMGEEPPVPGGPAPAGEPMGAGPTPEEMAAAGGGAVPPGI